jgi:glutaredoxin
VLFTRQGCHLCDLAYQQLREEQSRRGFALEVIDIDTDPDLAARYGEQVPVVTIDGKVRFRGAINRVLLNRLLRAEARAISIRPEH